MIFPRFRIERRGELDFVAQNLGPDGGARVFVTTRRGGCSFGRGDLNLSYGTGDEEENVVENRRLLGEALGITIESVARLRQIHSARVIVLSKKSWETVTGSAPEGDAMITTVPDRWLAVSIGDCQAIAIYEAERRVLALAHAGWAGTAKRIVAATIQRLKEEFDCSPANMWGALLPTIRQSAYQVDGPVFREFEKHWQDWRKYFTDHRDGRAYLDLTAANVTQLVEGGVPIEQIEDTGLCTATLSSLFFSHRRDGLPGGRMLALAAIRNPQ